MHIYSRVVSDSGDAELVAHKLEDLEPRHEWLRHRYLVQ
jgi:hypothetical protein